VSVALGPVFTDDELTLFARANGRASFPATRESELDDAGWKAVARGLEARGMLDGSDGPAFAAGVDALLRPLLLAERSLLGSLRSARSDGGYRHWIQTLWRRGDALVASERTDAGHTQVSASDDCAVGAMLTRALEAVSDARSEPGEPFLLKRTDLITALELGNAGALAELIERHPQAATYVTAYAQPRHVLDVMASRITGDSSVDEGVAIVETADGELWLERDGLQTPGMSHQMVELERVSPERARTILTGIVDVFRRA